jgi:hypothetical protein
MAESQKRFFGLDMHKEYFVTVTVNKDLETVFLGQSQINFNIEKSPILITKNRQPCTFTTENKPASSPS